MEERRARDARIKKMKDNNKIADFATDLIQNVVENLATHAKAQIISIFEIAPDEEEVSQQYSDNYSHDRPIYKLRQKGMRHS